MREQQAGQDVLQRCFCLMVRRASRAISQAYDLALSRDEITSGQYTILAQIKLRGRVTSSSLAKSMCIERTSLTRNLQRLEKMGAVMMLLNETDLRRRYIILTERGEKVLAQGFPKWGDAQSQVIGFVGETKWANALLAASKLVSAAATNERRTKPSAKAEKLEFIFTERTGWLKATQFEIMKRQMCMATTLRRCARAVSRPYDLEMRRTKLKISQFHLLAAIDALPHSRLNALVDSLTLDQTTLTRMLQRLVRMGFVSQGEDADDKSGYVLTKSGRALLLKAVASWQHVQKKLENDFTSQFRTKTYADMHSVQMGGKELFYKLQSAMKPN